MWNKKEWAKKYNREYRLRYSEQDRLRKKVYWLENKETILAKRRERYKQDPLYRNRVLTYSLSARLRGSYGITIAQRNILMKQACSICGLHKKRMDIDHVIRGSYRGVLCVVCNTSLGWYEKHRDSVSAYLRI